jgi:hypothetical protein
MEAAQNHRVDIVSFFVRLDPESALSGGGWVAFTGVCMCLCMFKVAFTCESLCFGAHSVKLWIELHNFHSRARAYKHVLTRTHTHSHARSRAITHMHARTQ